MYAGPVSSGVEMKFACESTHKETHKDILQYRFRGTVTFCVKYRGTVTFCVGVEMKTLPVNVIVCLHMHNSNRKIGNPAAGNRYEKHRKPRDERVREPLKGLSRRIRQVG